MFPLSFSREQGLRGCAKEKVGGGKNEESKMSEIMRFYGRQCQASVTTKAK